MDAIAQEVEWLKRSGNYNVTLNTNTNDHFGLSHQKDLVLFRLVQETINNIIKHSLASSIMITLEHVDGELLLSIADNGIGFNPEEVNRKGMGLSGLFKRAKAIQGDINIVSAPGKGTTVAIKVPYP